MIPSTFHGDDVIPAAPEKALFHILPVPLEKTVSYMNGTALGPEAIIEASCQLELFDGKSVPAEHGLYTHSPLDCSLSIKKVIKTLEKSIESVLRYNAIPVTLGGEHSLTHGCVRGLKRFHDDFGVIQFDAHADLRDSYGGSKQSHASVMRRITEENIPVFQIGTRSYSLEEHNFRIAHNVPYYDAETIWQKGAENINLPVDFPEKVYITFDVDCFDTPIIPATGTPVPGGLDWYQVAALLQTIMQDRICLGYDIVELAPLPNHHGVSFAIAQLTYNIMGYISRSVKNKSFFSLQ